MLSHYFIACIAGVPVHGEQKAAARNGGGVENRGGGRGTICSPRAGSPAMEANYFIERDDPEYHYIIVVWFLYTTLMFFELP